MRCEWRFDDSKRHMDVRIGELRDDIRKLANDVAALFTALQANTRVLDDVVRRLDRHETILQVLLERRL